MLIKKLQLSTKIRQKIPNFALTTNTKKYQNIGTETYILHENIKLKREIIQMKLKKSLTSLMAVSCIIGAIPVTNASATNDPKVYVNIKEKTPEQANVNFMKSFKRTKEDYIYEN